MTSSGATGKQPLQLGWTVAQDQQV